MRSYLKALLVGMSLAIVFGAGTILGSKVPEGHYVLATTIVTIATAFTLIGYAGKKKIYISNSDEDEEE